MIICLAKHEAMGGAISGVYKVLLILVSLFHSSEIVHPIIKNEEQGNNHILGS